MIGGKISKEFENCQTEKKIKFLTNNHYMKEIGHSCKLQCTQVLFRNKAKCKNGSISVRKTSHLPSVLREVDI